MKLKALALALVLLAGLLPAPVLAAAPMTVPEPVMAPAALPDNCITS